MENEKRLTDANALIEQVKDTCREHFGFRSYQYVRDFIADVVGNIRNAPTVDAVEVVRCKDCIHSEDRGSVFGDRYCRIWHDSTPKDGYCHEGERGAPM